MKVCRFAALCAAGLAMAAGVHGQDTPPVEPRPVASDFGGVGLLQMPTARMSEAGNLSLNFSKVEPYSRLGLTVQPFDWLEATFSYIDVDNRLYGPEIAGSQSYKDKGFDVKLRLLEETARRPEIAVGARDIGGTALFGSEYLVATKRYGTLDFTLGIGWGYLGSSDNISNPLAWADSGFKNRSGRSSGDRGGTFNTGDWFSGPAAMFGGVQWQTPWKPLQLMVEYDANDYSREPLDNPQKQDSPFNFGAVYQLTNWIDLRAGWERGNTAMVGLTLHTNFGRGSSAPAKVSDPPAPAMRTRPAPSRAAEANQDWSAVARDLEDNAGYRVTRISRRDREIVVEGEQTRYFHAAKGLGRSARILDHVAADDVDWFTAIETRYGLPLVEASLNREALRRALEGTEEDADEVLYRSVERVAALPRDDTELYSQEPDPFNWALGVGYRQNLGGPDGFVLYQFSANLDAEYRFTPNTWVSGRVSGNLLNNFDRFEYDGDSGLPRVRTDLRSYWTESDITMPQLQLNHAKQLGPELFGAVYGGYLESMFAGVGGELLLRPMNSDWALGADVNWVRQRAFAQDFGLRDYDTVTGHLTGYYRGFEDVLAKLSVGRYLAGDIGTTLDVSREFRNGVRFGAWATLTNASREEFGEGSFDKGIYVSIPFDEMMSRSALGRAELRFAPLTRDGGARLERQTQLFELTEGRNARLFQSNIHRLTE